MVIDEVIVQKILTLRDAYPSDSLQKVGERATEYFSHETTAKRVASITYSWVQSKGSYLNKFLPLLLFFGTETEDSIKIVLDIRKPDLLQLWKKMCLELGIPSHLKKYGSSIYKVYREIPEMPDLLLSEMLLGSSQELPIDICCISNFLEIHFREEGEHEYFFKFPKTLSSELLSAIVVTLQSKSTYVRPRISDKLLVASNRFTLKKSN